MECACIPLGGAFDGSAGLLGECNAPAGHKYVAADGGDGFTVALATDGAVYGWGRSFYGELPVRSDQADGRQETAVAGAGCGRGVKRLASEYGSPTPPTRLLVPVTCTRVSCGANHVLALSSAGHVLAWGWNASGQAGQSATVVCSPLAVQFSDSADAPTRCVQIAAGGMHSLAIDARGRAWSWGQNVYGQLGVGADGDSERHSTPALVVLPPDTKAVYVAAGWAHSALVSSAGEVLTCGWGLYHQLGHGVTQDESSPTAIAALRGLDSAIEQVACGNWHTAARTASGDLYTWGWGPDGQLGHGSAAVTQVLPRVVTVGNHTHATEAQDALALACGPRHTLTLCRDGTIQCWGPAPSPPPQCTASNVARKNAEHAGKMASRSELRRPSSGHRVQELAVGHSHAVLLLDLSDADG